MSETRREDLKREFQARGINIAAWAVRNGFEPSVVYALLDGRTRGLRGKAFDVARVMGMTPAPDCSNRFDFLEVDEDEPEQTR